jgi:hypothetical protein
VRYMAKTGATYSPGCLGFVSMEVVVEPGRRATANRVYGQEDGSWSNGLSSRRIGSEDVVVELVDATVDVAIERAEFIVVVALVRDKGTVVLSVSVVEDS